MTHGKGILCGGKFNKKTPRFHTRSLQCKPSKREIQRDASRFLPCRSTKKIAREVTDDRRLKTRVVQHVLAHHMPKGTVLRKHRDIHYASGTYPHSRIDRVELGELSELLGEFLREIFVSNKVELLVEEQRELIVDPTPLDPRKIKLSIVFLEDHIGLVSCSFYILKGSYFELLKGSRLEQLKGRRLKALISIEGIDHDQHIDRVQRPIAVGIKAPNRLLLSFATRNRSRRTDAIQSVDHAKRIDRADPTISIDIGSKSASLAVGRRDHGEFREVARKALNG